MRYLNCFNQFIREYEKTYPLPLLEKSIQHMEAVKILIEEKLKNATMGEPNPELVQQTIQKFFRWAIKPSTEDFNWLEVALLCRGLLVEIPGYGSLMESEHAVKVLLRKFSTQYQSQMLSAYPWQGLLNTYLNASPRQNPVLEKNWMELRTFLENTLDKVASQSSFKPRWLEALIYHRIILAENATQSLAKDALEGRMEMVDRIDREVNIPPTSWFWPELLMSQVKAIAAYPDDKFKPAIDLVLPQLQVRKECLDNGLARILDRYAQCGSLELHPELESMATSRWKNPSLEKQRNWERVTPEAKRMVQRWLAQKDIYDILGKLVEDNRRYEFWLQFLDQIDYTFVWLGKDARESFPDLLHNRQDRCAVLNHSGKPDNNVIMMKIRDVFITESGARAGGKCWAYREEKMRPLLQRSSLSYDFFRDPNNNLFKTNWGESDGLIHISGSWEKTFQNELTRFHIEPDTMAFDEIVHRYQLRVETLPSGTERIRHDYAAGILADLLRRHGFSYKFKEGFYRNHHSASVNAKSSSNVSPFIESQCPKCSQKLRFSEGKSLKKITCPTCRHEFYSSGY